MRSVPALVFAAAMNVVALPVFAQTAEGEGSDALFDALALPEILQIMRDEGISHGETIASDMFPSGPNASWPGMVSDIYDLDQMEDQVRTSFAVALEGEDVGEMVDFFTTEPGVSIVNLELEARRALLSDKTEEASKDRAAIAMLDETPRALMVKDFVDANDLVETNVVGALNSNYAFMTGLMDGGAVADGMTAETALQSVQSQEPQIRQDTTEWLYGFLLMAYEPVSDEDLQTYIDFSKTEAGQDLNAALLMAFDDMFNDVSHQLGLAASQFLMSQEL